MCCSTGSKITSGIKTIVHYISSQARCNPSETPLLDPLFVLFWIYWMVFWQVSLWEKWSSCLRGYCFRLGVPASLFKGMSIGDVFLVFPGVLLAHTLVLPFIDLGLGWGVGGGGELFLLGFSWAPSVGLKSVHVGLWCQAVLKKN